MESITVCICRAWHVLSFKVKWTKLDNLDKNAELISSPKICLGYLETVSVLFVCVCSNRIVTLRYVRYVHVYVCLIDVSRDHVYLGVAHPITWAW